MHDNNKFIRTTGIWDPLPAFNISYLLLTSGQRARIPSRKYSSNRWRHLTQDLLVSTGTTFRYCFESTGQCGIKWFVGRAVSMWLQLRLKILGKVVNNQAQMAGVVASLNLQIYINKHYSQQWCTTNLGQTICCNTYTIGGLWHSICLQILETICTLLYIFFIFIVF